MYGRQYNDKKKRKTKGKQCFPKTPHEKVDNGTRTCRKLGATYNGPQNITHKTEFKDSNTTENRRWQVMVHKRSDRTLDWETRTIPKTGGDKQCSTKHHTENWIERLEHYWKPGATSNGPQNIRQKTGPRDSNTIENRGRQGGEIRCSEGASNSCSTIGNRRATADRHYHEHNLISK